MGPDALLALGLSNDQVRCMTRSCCRCATEAGCCGGACYVRGQVEAGGRRPDGAAGRRPAQVRITQALQASSKTSVTGPACAYGTLLQLQMRVACRDASCQPLGGFDQIIGLTSSLYLTAGSWSAHWQSSQPSNSGWLLPESSQHPCHDPCPPCFAGSWSVRMRSTRLWSSGWPQPARRRGATCTRSAIWRQPALTGALRRVSPHRRLP